MCQKKNDPSQPLQVVLLVVQQLKVFILSQNPDSVLLRTEAGVTVGDAPLLRGASR